MNTTPCNRLFLVAAVALGGCVGSVSGPRAPGSSTGSGGAAANNPPGVGGSNVPAAGNGGSTVAGVGGVGSPPVITAGSGGTGPIGPPATDPGRVTLHRLNKAEYNNTVVDLLGTTLRPADAFPADDPGGDFDNNSDVLSLSPLHLSMYQTAAQSLIDAALANVTQRAKLVTCDLAAAQGSVCARTVLTAFMPRAWRRPVVAADIDTHMAVVTAATAQGLTVEESLKLALAAVLMSPNFVFRVELDTAPTSLTPHPLTGHELASRLSYFLWSTMPDDALFSAASDGSLVKADMLAAQVDRMLASPKAQALIDNFAGQWLYIRDIADAAPNPTIFAGFDQPLRAAMKSEAELLFRDVALNGMSVGTLLTANYLYANDRLAKHYGLAAVTSTTPIKVTLTPDSHRGGILAQGGLLTSTSHANKTSPVKRGKWVLNNLLCLDVPAPPPGVQTSLDNSPVMGTLRQILEAHRAAPACSVCHNLMDPIGFGLENYDGIGAYRAQEVGMNIDSAGQLPSGAMFSGAAQLSSMIAADPNFPGCVAQKLYAYALGRLPEKAATHMDGQTLASISTGFKSGGLLFKDLVKRIVTAPTFLNRRGEPVAP